MADFTPRFIKGKINRPNPREEAANIVLTAKIKKGTETIEQEFKAAIMPWTDEEVVANNYASLLEKSILGSNPDKEHVSSNLVLPTTGSNNVTISWTSNNPAIIDSAGKVNRPTYSQGDLIITLEATIKSGEVASKKQFVITVSKKAQTVEESLEALFESLVPKILDTNTSWNSLVNNLKMPSTETAEANVVFSMLSDDTTHMSNLGIIKRPKAIDGNAPVKLTFTLSKDSNSIVKKVTAIVLAEEVVS